ncbi:GntR family transcriptional regulator [Streptacidiphilus sp. MAP5-52]|uniref:GntR family transcriptional regulator n=1 Tax=Streptacidiphilus sp. MAP5-52 TaxID=3156267 RepID=UPI0035139DE6
MLTSPSHSAVTARTIFRDLKDQIRAGQPAPGHDLPSERDLALVHQVSRQTARAAVTLLQDEGWVQRDRLGAFVLNRESGTTRTAAGDGGFPGTLIRPAAAIGTASSGTLRETALPVEPAQDLRATPGVSALVHDHRLHGPHGHVLQTTRTYLAPDLPDQLPQLASLRAAARLQRTQHWPSGLGEPELPGTPGLGVDLADLFRWLRAQGRTVRLLDQTADGPTLPGVITIRRHAVDDLGRPLTRSTITLAAGDTDPTTLACYGHPVPSRRGTPPSGYTLNPQDRAWLEGWILSRPADRGLALRARIILLGEQHSPQAVATALNISPHLACAWQNRYLAGGLPALQAPARRGRPRSIPSTTTQAPEPLHRARSARA